MALHLVNAVRCTLRTGSPFLNTKYSQISLIGDVRLSHLLSCVRQVKVSLIEVNTEYAGISVMSKITSLKVEHGANKVVSANTVIRHRMRRGAWRSPYLFIYSKGRGPLSLAVEFRLTRVPALGSSGFLPVAMMGKANKTILCGGSETKVPTLLCALIPVSVKLFKALRIVPLADVNSCANWIHLATYPPGFQRVHRLFV